MKRYGVVGLLVGLAMIPFAETPMGAADPVPTFHKDVLPILQKNCQSCHRPGQVAPMALLSYDQVRPWARAIKTKVESRQMPPWFADTPQREFTNDASLSKADIATIAKWVDAGAPAGNSADAPPARVWPEAGWLIQPDIVIKAPEFMVPAHPPGNVIEWTTVVVPSGLTKDTWVTSMEVKPSNYAVTHHICARLVAHSPNVEYYKPYWSDKPRDKDGVEVKDTEAERARRTTGTEGGRSGSQQIDGGLCYVPGTEAVDYRPFQAGKLFPAGVDIEFRFHYTPNGKDVIDRTELGLTVSEVPPPNRFLSVTIQSPTDRKRFAIPPNDPNWTSPPAEVTFNTDAKLVSVMPHMHVRGKDMTYKVMYPDGRSEIAVRIAPYDFNWQLTYELAKPIELPKGSKLHVDAHYDNSAANKFNPNPNQTVYYGDMTWEEMMSPFFGVVVPSSVDPAKVMQRNLGTTQGDGA